ncbi:hypothetical protein Cantr_05663 [Candida viswanathii]|uniref:Extracellular mutant protein 11 C-terminal domain-containing protein n=1 Tax=Candida viswanathii TaxID=5486 RepID=A0A367XR95_9ASCO|nr:hypothetical protein Cantr_05663 [Candida viswanathii]
MSQHLRQSAHASSKGSTGKSPVTTKSSKHSDASRYMVTPVAAVELQPSDDTVPGYYLNSNTGLNSSPEMVARGDRDNEVLFQASDASDSFQSNGIAKLHAREVQEAQPSSESYCPQYENSSFVYQSSEMRHSFECNNYPLSHPETDLPDTSLADHPFDFPQDLPFTEWSTRLSSLAQEEIELHRALITRRYKLLHQFDVLNSIVNEHAQRLLLKEDQLVEKMAQIKMRLSEIMELDL